MAIEVLLAAALVNPLVAPLLQRKGGEALARLADILIPGHPPVIRYYLERCIPGGIMPDVSPYQVDMFVEADLMDQRVADELAAHSTRLLRLLYAPDLLRPFA